MSYLKKYTMNYSKLINFITLLIIILGINSCGIYRKTDATKTPVNAKERVKKNMEEGRGFRIKNLGKIGQGGEFQFASSNELWRASIEILDFVPLVNADYGGGIIITDWYNSEENEKEYIKITVNFLTNEIRSDAIKVNIHKKICEINNNCKINLVKSELNNDIKLAILKKAALIKTKDLEKIREEEGEVRVVPTKKKN